MTHESNLTDTEVTRKFDTYDYDFEASKFRRFLWFCAGADIQLLKRSPHSERVMMEGIGGVVFATSVLALFSGFFAFYSVFGPKIGIGLEATQQSSLLPWIGACIFAVLWSGIIFNLDRFIVSSTGDGDGTDNITWGEFLKAGPRLLMALLIGVTIAAPLEIQIMKSELDVRINSEQRKETSRLRQIVDEKYNRTLGEIDALIAEPQNEMKRLQDVAAAAGRQEDEARIKRDGELVGSGPTGTRGKGVQYEAMDSSYQAAKAKADAAKAASDIQKPILEAKIADLRNKRSSIEAERAIEYKQIDQQVSNIDGLATRILLAKQLYPAISWALMLLLVFIEIAPIIFKMMLSKGPYKYLVENQKYIVLAKWGIEAKKIYVMPAGSFAMDPRTDNAAGIGNVTASQPQEASGSVSAFRKFLWWLVSYPEDRRSESTAAGHSVDRFHQPETLLNYQRGQLQVEQNLTNLQLERYQAEKVREIEGGAT